MGLINEVTDIQIYPSISVAKQDGNFITTSVLERDGVTTKGWDVQMICKDQSTSWLLMDEYKAEKPIELAEYAFAKGLAVDPVFM